MVAQVHICLCHSILVVIGVDYKCSSIFHQHFEENENKNLENNSTQVFEEKLVDIAYFVLLAQKFVLRT